MINLSDDGRPQGPRSQVMPAIEPREDVGFLSDSEEDELERMLKMEDKATLGKEQILADLMGVASAEIED